MLNFSTIKKEVMEIIDSGAHDVRELWDAVPREPLFTLVECILIVILAFVVVPLSIIKFIAIKIDKRFK